MDPFQIRLDFLSLLRRLTASQQSIAKLVAFASVHAPKARNDIWDCIVSETAKANLNARLNILFLLDALVSSSGAPTTSSAQGGYLDLAARDLRDIMALVVPDTRDGVQLNASSALRVLATWNVERVFSPALIKDAEQDIVARQSRVTTAPREEQRPSDLSEADVLRRIEEDRERHKRLRERGWILPSKSFLDALPSAGAPRTGGSHLRSTPSHSTKASPASPREPPGPPRASGVKRPGQGTLPPAKRARPSASASAADDATSHGPSLPDPLDVEFDELWETLSELNEDDLETIQEDDAQWWGSETALFRQADEERQTQEARRREEERAQQAAIEEADRLQRLQEEEERQQRLAMRQASEAQRSAERNGSAHSSSPARGWNPNRASHEQRAPPGPASSGFAGRGGRGFRPIGAPNGPAMLNGHGHAAGPGNPAASTPPRNGAFGNATPPAAPSSFSRGNLGSSRSSSPYAGPPAGPAGRGGPPGRFRGAGGPRRGGWRDAR